MNSQENKLLKLIAPFMVIYALNACNTNCEVDNRFKEIFFETIDFLETPYKFFPKSVKVKELRNSMYFIIGVTGIEPKGYDIEYGIYNLRKDFYADKERWIDWYDNNKCKITYEGADSLFIEYMVNYQGWNSKPPLKKE